MTRDETFTKLEQLDALTLEFQKYMSDRLTSARPPQQHDHCFGYSVGCGVMAAITAREAVTRIRVAMLQIHQSDERVKS